MRTRTLVTLALLALLGCSCSSRATTKTVRVAAAADLAKAFEELGKAFTAKTGIEPVFTFGSSGLLAKQIQEAAPFYLFASADKTFVDLVAQSGKCDPKTTTGYARGRIVVWAPNGTSAPKQLTDLVDPAWRRIAIANPEHAPYGRAAKQALEKAGMWPRLDGRIVLGDNVQATLQFAQTKNVDAAIIALSLAVVNDGGTFLPIDPSMYDPLDQQLIVCGRGPEADYARKLAAFIASPNGREIMTRYGFLLPDEAMHANKK